MPENMLRQTLLVKWTFVLILYTRLSFGVDAVSDTCKVCDCALPYVNCEKRNLTSIPNIPAKFTYLFLSFNSIKNIEKGSFAGLSNLQWLGLSHNSIKNIENGSFAGLSNLRTLFLYNNSIKSIEKGSFAGLSNLRILFLSENSIKNIEKGSFVGLSNLQYLNFTNNSITDIRNGLFVGLSNLQKLYLSNNQIKSYEDGAFLFLPSIVTIELSGNNDMMCGCHLPALEIYRKNNYNKTLDVKGKCQTDLGQKIPILSYSQCTNYSLFPRDLQCQTCSGMNCNDSEVKTCPGAEPVCRLTLSMNGATLKFERTCSTYKECVKDFKNNNRTCNKRTDGTFCTGCCVGNSCNKNDFIGWTSSFEFHLTFKNINEYNISGKNISKTMELELGNFTGAFSVTYCGLVGSKRIFTIYCRVLRETTKDDLWLKIKQAFDASRALRELGFQQSTLELIDGMVCQEDTTFNNGIFHWPVTKTGTNATLPCRANVATRYCSSKTVKHGEITPLKCSLFTGIWQEPDMSKCNNTERITKRLKNITSQTIDEGNIDNISKDVLNVSQKSVYFNKQDVDSAVDILERMVPFTSNVSANTTLNNTLLSINNIINTPEEVFIQSEQEKGSVSRILDIIETIPERIPLEEQQFTVSYSNLAFGVAKVNKDTFDGLLYGVSYGTDETKANTVLSNQSYTDSQQEDIQTTTFISIPNSLPKHLKEEEKSAFSRVSFFSMRDDKLYRVIQNSNTDRNTRINSYVLAASVPNITINSLDEPVNISFSIINKNSAHPKCAFWNTNSELNPHWSTEGCKISKSVPGKQIICSCDHLTSFALLMDVYQNEGDVKHPETLSIISITGCAISIVFLVLTILIHACVRKLWELTASKILVSLCVSLAVSNLIFVAGMHREIETLAACKAVAALLHYVILTSLVWMSVEAVYVLLSTVAVFRTYQTSFIKWSSLLAWGLPTVIVIITLAINYTDNYVKRNGVCWLSKTYFFAAFLTPVVLILICNIIMFVLVIWRIILKRNTFGHKRRKVRVFGIVGLLFLFGFPWAFAFFAVDKAAEVFKFLFTIFLTLQGMFIFIFYCVCKEDTRVVITKYISTRKRVIFATDRRKRCDKKIEDETAETNF